MYKVTMPAGAKIENPCDETFYKRKRRGRINSEGGSFGAVEASGMSAHPGEVEILLFDTTAKWITIDENKAEEWEKEAKLRELRMKSGKSATKRYVQSEV